MILPKKNDEFIKGLIKQGEGENLDFKVAVTNPLKFAKTLAAFANTSGGKVLIGVNDQHKIIGIDAEEEIHMVEQANSRALTPAQELNYEVYEVMPDFGDDVEPVSLLLVHVEKSEFLCYYSPEGSAPILYRRVGDVNIQVSISSAQDSPPEVN